MAARAEERSEGQGSIEPLCPFLETMGPYSILQGKLAH
jgi:hypothetical protein